MKNLVLALFMLTLCVNNSSAQNVVRKGKTFKQVNRGISHKADTLVTTYTFEDSKGTKYPIIINKSTGSCYVWRVSKNGKKYKSYMKSEISQQICEELDIEYKSKNRK